MARKLRVEFEGAVYHVIARGNYRADVFAERAEKGSMLYLCTTLPLGQSGRGHGSRDGVTS